MAGKAPKTGPTSQDPREYLASQASDQTSEVKYTLSELLRHAFGDVVSTEVVDN